MKKIEELKPILKRLEEINYHDCVFSLAVENDKWLTCWDGYTFTNSDINVIIEEVKEKMIEVIARETNNCGGLTQAEALVSLYEWANDKGISL